MSTITDEQSSPAPTAQGERKAVFWATVVAAAYVLSSVAPAVIALLLYTLDARGVRFEAYLVEKPPDGAAGVVMLIFLLNAWCLALAFIARKAVRARPNDTTVKGGILGALGALMLLDMPFFLGTPGELLSTAVDAGQGTGVFGAMVLFLAPPMGLVGWGIGSAFGAAYSALRSITPPPVRPLVVWTFVGLTAAGYIWLAWSVFVLMR